MSAPSDSSLISCRIPFVLNHIRLIPHHIMKTKPSITDTKLSRRNFLRGSAVSATAFMIVPGSVLGLRGATSPNAKLNIAGIGIGGQGASDLSNMESENIVALCDVDQGYAGPIFKNYSKAKPFA